MPPRFAYWTILLDGKPTAFRAAEQQELLPTFKRLQEKHPDAVMRWFARGKLWTSPEEARAENSRRAAAADAPARGRDWRPGGSHRDPRQPYKDAKKQRNQDRRQRRFEYRTKDERPRDDKPAETRPPKKDWSGPPASGRREFKPWNDRPKPAGRWPRDDREKGPGPKTGWSSRPPRPREDRPQESRPAKKEWGGPPAAGRREFKPWDDRPRPAGRWPRDDREKGPGPKPGGWDKRPARPRDERFSETRPPKKEWRPSGPREAKPWSKPRPEGGSGARGQGTGDRKQGPGAEPGDRRPWRPRTGDRPPFKGPRDGVSRGSGPRNKGPRGPKR